MVVGCLSRIFGLSQFELSIHGAAGHAAFHAYDICDGADQGEHQDDGNEGEAARA